MLCLKTLTYALSPVLLVQGFRVKKKMIRLAEPEGLRQGEMGHQKKLSLLILGDSAAAGVGVQHQDDALLGAVLSGLHADFHIRYCLEAETGRTTLDVLSVLKSMKNQHFDIVITSLGVNDVTKLISTQTWMKQQKKLYAEIERKFTPQQVFITLVPPMQHFPALPYPLGWLFGQYAKAMNQQLKKWMKTQQHYQYISFNLGGFQQQNLTMAKDGFHPSKEIYQLWALPIIHQIQQFFKSS